jgi:drug/metabolite transporter (DMT)-like permease
MLPALLTTLFFALSSILARRSIDFVGTQRANFARQLMGLLLLGLWAHLLGQGLSGPTFGIFFLSGVVGFGLGDWALFEALPRIGPGLTVLLCQCLAPLVGALTEWLWLGTRVTQVQMLSSAIIITGVGVALAPDRRSSIPTGHRIAGFLFGLISATGQGWGAVLSRFAFERARQAHFSIDGVTAAYQRLWGGAFSIGLLLFLHGLHSRWRPAEREVARPDWKGAFPWVAANGLVGPTIGVSCYQWALKSAPSSIVLPIVATTPLVAMLLAVGNGGVRPSRRAMMGAIISVAGVIILVRNS